ncbi:MAG: hypothetical protein J6I79_02100 [Paludibacteraceae bacterium]|nr:hypothetical protein [Paludibacteraceae bacterium]
MKKGTALTKSILYVVCISTCLFTACGNEDDDSKTDTNKATIDIVRSKEQGVIVNGLIGEHTYVDLGLKSRTLWATYNVGASKTSESGNYFAWGETKSKPYYRKNTYKWSSLDTLTENPSGLEIFNIYTLTKYYGNERVLEAEDDAATANWGPDWRMPTKAELEELLESCEWKWTDHFKDTNAKGCIGTSKINGYTIFFPFMMSALEAKVSRYVCYYWSSTLDEDNIGKAYCGILSDGRKDISPLSQFRYSGELVRAVVSKKE